LAATYLADSSENTDIMQAVAFIVNLLIVFYPPAIAAMALAIAKGILKLGMKKGEDLCRSLSMTLFILLYGIYLCILTLSTGSAILGNATDPMILASLMMIVVSIPMTVAMFYLWLLAISMFDAKKAWKTVVPAAVFAMMTGLIYLIPVIKGVNEGIYIPDYISYSIFSTQTLLLFLSDFLLGFVLLYHMNGRKLDNLAYAFAALYIALPIANELIGMSLRGGFEPGKILEAVIRIVFLYGISRMNLTTLSKGFWDAPKKKGDKD
jgi:hypothetical protein